MDRAIAGQFDEEHFVTVQMAHLDVGSGRLRWVNAGHPHPLLIRGDRVVGALDSPTTLPIGFGGADPQVSEVRLEPGDRVLLFTDGITEEHLTGGDLFGERRLIELLRRSAKKADPFKRRCDGSPTPSSAPEAKSPMTTRPCSCWRGVGGSADHLAELDA